MHLLIFCNVPILMKKNANSDKVIDLLLLLFLLLNMELF